MKFSATVLLGLRPNSWVRRLGWIYMDIRSTLLVIFVQERYIYIISMLYIYIYKYTVAIPCHLMIRRSHYKAPYEPTSMMKCHKDFEDWPLPTHMIFS